MSIGIRTLVLNGDYIPVNLLDLNPIPIEDAITRVINGTCVTIDTYDRVFKTPRVENRFAMPSVIARKEHFKRPTMVALSRRNLLLRDNHKCQYCGIALNETTMTMDHYVPASRGGETTWDNILSSCSHCNYQYGNIPAYMKKPKHKPYIPTYGKLVVMRRHTTIHVDHESWIPWIQPWFGEIIITGNQA